MRSLCAVDGLIVQYSRNRAVLTCYHEDMESLADIPNFDEVGELQRFVDQLFAAEKLVDALDAQVQAELYDLPIELLEIVSMLPPGCYERARLTSQLNSALAAHGWAQRFGTVE